MGPLPPPVSIVDGLGGGELSAGTCGHEECGTCESWRDGEETCAQAAEWGRAETAGSADGENLGGGQTPVHGSLPWLRRTIIGKR